MIYQPMDSLIESLFPLQVWEVCPDPPDSDLTLDDWPVAHAWIVGKYEDYAQQQAARLAEAERLLAALVEPRRAGWGEEPVIECLYCGVYDREPDMDYPDLNAHDDDCPVAQARAFLVGRSGAES